MPTKNCEDKVYARLEEETPEAPATTQQAVAREMCRLLDSNLLEEDLDDKTADIDYLISRLNVREGDDNPSLKTKWNSWVGQMVYLYDGDYNQYQI